MRDLEASAPPPFALRTQTRVLDRIRDRRRERMLARLFKRATTIPPPEAFGAFGASVIVPPARIDTPRLVHIGDRVVIHEYIWITVVQKFDDIVPRFEVGDGTRIGRFCQISGVGEIILEEDVGISDEVLLADTSHDYEDPDAPWFRQAMTRPKRVVIGAGAIVGLGSMILPGVTVGKGAYVAEGSVVGTDVAPHTVVAGNPARVVTRGFAGLEIAR